MIASAPSPGGSFPVPRTRLIGRSTERALARGYLLDEAVPLLTLTGPGGVGKTRLALAIARDAAASFADGVIWVDLASLTDGALVPATCASALGLSPTAGRSLTDGLTHALRSRQLLLLLDNCEHVAAETAELVEALLALCPALQVLATSRAALRIRGEQVLPVDPLPLPTVGASSLEELAPNEAVRLFVARARSVYPAFRLDARNAQTIAALCHALDGLPLAIELAAARIPVLPPLALLTHLDRRLSLLMEGPRDLPIRQQTMRDAIAWSYDLLAPHEQHLFRRLAVFVGGCTLDAAATVAGGDQDVLASISNLVASSMLQREDGADGEPRYRMLETIREFGLEELAAHGDEAETRERHAAYFLDLVERIDARVAPHLPHAAHVFARLTAEHPNLRAALTWLEATGATEPFVRLSGALHAFWLHFGHIAEGRARLEQAVAWAEDTPAPTRVWAQVGLVGVLYTQRIDPGRTLALIDEAVALARASGDMLCCALAVGYRGMVAVAMGDHPLAQACCTEARAAFATLPPWPWVVRWATHVETLAGWTAIARGDLVVAEDICARVVEQMRTLECEHDAPYPYIAYSLGNLGHTARGLGQPGAALSRYQEALRAHADNVLGLVQALGGVAGCLAALGRWSDAARIFGAIEAHCTRSGLSFRAHVFDWQRALGLPEPWQRADEPFGEPAGLRLAVLRQGHTPLPPLPDQEAAARHWAAGATMPVAEAVAEALAVDLATLMPDAIAEPPHIPTFGLSPRELEVLGLLCERLSDQEIAERLFVSRRTVSSHVAHLFTKIDVNSRRKAAAFAARHGLA